MPTRRKRQRRSWKNLNFIQRGNPVRESTNHGKAFEKNSKGSAEQHREV